MSCRLCDGTCSQGGVDGLAVADLAWLWTQLADAADRRGDPLLTTGSATVTAPADPAGRAAALGLLDRRHLRDGQRVRVDLEALAARISPLSPGVVAAHAVGRRLALRAATRAARVATEAELRDRLEALVEGMTGDAWAILRRSGWVTRIIRSEDPALPDKAAAVLAQLPAESDLAVDRRLIAQNATGDPHDLDAGRPTGGLALALLAATRRIASGLTAREAWAAVGVAYDDITGGITTLGIAPDGWTVPAGQPVTLPPRVLQGCTWPAGSGDVWVTENPSVLAAASAIGGARVVCTSGTPSRVEVAAIAALAAAGWRLHVRADFDDAGLNHVNAILAAAPSARPWRMSADDYLTSLTEGEGVPLRVERLPDTPWDPSLRNLMLEHGVAAYEESLVGHLLADIDG